MILRMPTYCKNFKCSADKCTDNCCVGWEIDIDPHSAEYYKTVGGDFGERLKREINYGEVCSFKLKGERCFFLNGSNLCDIIINLGEDRLCQICRDHPRYFEWFSDVKEGGIGLCCKEAARLILEREEGFLVYDTPCDDEGEEGYSEELYDYFLFARDEIIKMLEDESLPLSIRLASVGSFAHKVQENADNNSLEKEEIKVSDKIQSLSLKVLIEKFKTLEVIDEKWTDYLKHLTGNIDIIEKTIKENKTPDSTVSRYLKNIAVYFIWRYFMKGVFDEDILSKVWLMRVSVAFIEAMFVSAHCDGNEMSLELCSTLAKNYSKEVEYSEENLQALCEQGSASAPLSAD